MKTTSPSLFFSKRSLLLLSTVAVGLVAPSLVRAADGTWTNVNGGTWSTPGNWSGGVVADGAGFTANFATLDLTAATTIRLDSSRTVGGLNFYDTATTYFGYTLDNNGNSANVLTLEGSTPLTSPTITVGTGTAGTSGNSATLNLILAGTAGFTKTGAGTLILTANNTYSGVTSISGGNAGHIQINSNAALGSSTLQISSANGGIRYGSAFNDLRAIDFGVNGGRIDTNGFDVTYSSAITGMIAGSNAFTKTGAGTLTLAGSNTLTGGGVNVSNGFLKIDSNARLGNGGGITLNGGSSSGIRYGAAFNDLRAIAIGNTGGALDTNGFDVTYSAAITAGGTGGLNKLGAGTLRLTNSGNSYTGVTTVSAGTLLINGSQTGGGNVNVLSGATLGGTGTILGTLNTTTINNGGFLSPGDGVGTLTINNNLSLSNGSTYSFQGGDLVAVGGTLTLTNNWTLSLSGLVDGGSVTIFTFGSLAASPDLVPTFDISQLGFTPTGPLSLTQVGNSIVLNGVQAIPEPSTYALLVLGFGAMVWMHRLRRRSAVN